MNYIIVFSLKCLHIISYHTILIRNHWSIPYIYLAFNVYKKYNKNKLYIIYIILKDTKKCTITPFLCLLTFKKKNLITNVRAHKNII